jgi:REP element-mobilizing transposase RayT
MKDWHRRSVRLHGYDYRQGGVYFVTICTQGRLPVLSTVTDGAIQLLPLGEIVSRTWLWLEQQYGYISLDAFVIMPNHLHGILAIHEQTDIRTKPLGSLVGAFKTVSTKAVNERRKTPGEGFWQRSFYEHIVRAEADLDRIRTYIADNPARWADDEEYMG